MLGFVFAATVIGVVGASGYRTVKLQTETVLWIEHTHRVIERIDDIMLAVSTAESAVRGFALSREQYLANDLEPLIHQAHSAYKDVAEMVRDNPVQQRRSNTLGPKLERRIVLLREYLERVSAGGTTQVLPESLQLSAELRTRTREMVEEERRLLEDRVTARTQQTTLALELYGIGLGLSGLFVVGAYLLMAREMRTRQRAETVLSQKHAETTVLLQMGELLQATLSANEAYSVIDNCAPRFFPAEPGCVFLRDAQRQLMVAKSRWGDYGAGSSDVSFAHDDCWALRRGRTHEIDTRGAHVRCKHSVANQLANSMCIPLIAHGELLGVLHVTTSQSLDSVEERSAIFADHLSMALANIELRERLREEAIRDPLTGLYNRRHTQEALERELRRASRTQEPIAVLMIDVDHFKKFNDTFGHQAGDHVLATLGKLLNTNTRGSDLVSRMGGEELLIIMPGAHEQDAHAKAELLRQEIAKLRLVHAGQDLGPITISVGVAVHPRHGMTSDLLLRSADNALYRAKGTGRDRVVIAA
jgi:diguanylate cyclase (GGDEF)-like protein